jgi:choline dehydrogenase-like flavoprotein
MKLESLSMVPEMLAVRIPGAGAEWQERLANLDHYAQWVALIRMRAKGRIRPTLFGGVDARYVPLPEDIADMRAGLVLLCKMFFAVGATEVYPGIARRPQVLRDLSEVRALEEGELTHDDFHMVASHLFGTACAGSDPRTSVVGPNLEVHGVRRLFVMDASVFPTNLGVNPQHSIMAVVFRAAERLANERPNPSAAGGQ